MNPPVVIILAAGKGERFLASGATTHKLDAPLGAYSVLEHVIRAVAEAGLRGHLVRPAGGTRGMGESVSLGVRATADAEGWLILPGDLPLIRPASLRAVAQALCQKSVVLPRYRQLSGHPVGFSRRWFPFLAALDGDVGARTVVKAARACGEVLDLTLADPGVTHDIDTVADLLAASRLHDAAAPGRMRR